jgi:hypothetical protein
MVRRKLGGVNAFGRGQALYNATSGQVIGAVGLSATCPAPTTGLVSLENPM